MLVVRGLVVFTYRSGRTKVRVCAREVAREIAGPQVTYCIRERAHTHVYISSGFRNCVPFSRGTGSSRFLMILLGVFGFLGWGFTLKYSVFPIRIYWKNAKFQCKKRD